MKNFKEARDEFVISQLTREEFEGEDFPDDEIENMLNRAFKAGSKWQKELLESKTKR